MKLSVKAKLFLGIGTSVILVFLIGFSSYRSLKELELDYEWVNHTEKVILKTNETLISITEAEANQRGYNFRGNKEFYTQFEIDANKAKDDINDLSNFISTDSEQLPLIKDLDRLINDKIGLMNSLIVNKNNGFDGSKEDLELANAARLKMDSIRITTNNILKAESTLLDERKAKSQESIDRTIVIILIGVILVLIIVFILFRNINKSFNTQIADRKIIRDANIALEHANVKNEEKNWILTGLSDLNEKLQGELSVKELSKNIIDTISSYSGGKIGAIYFLDEKNNDKVCLLAGYAFKSNNNKTTFNLNESWLGQVVKDRTAQIISGDLAGHLEISSGLLTSLPFQNILAPIYYNGNLKGIIEVGFNEQIPERSQIFFNNAVDLIGVAIDTAQSRELLRNLFEQTQQQAEELESQQEELRVSNEELLTKTELLQASEEELKVQQEELRQINTELEEKAEILEKNNVIVAAAKDSLAVKMKELEQASKYKSEFLANMSHELRTPLNSILILAKILKENKFERLSDDEVKYAGVIHRAGTDLLSLINDILDLSKIESGYIELYNEEVGFEVIKEDLKHLFDEVAKSKGVNFNVVLNKNLPKTLLVDKQRLEQILKNLLSNAFKFTPVDGTVEIKFIAEGNDVDIHVSDTGIGIAPEKQKLIFEAFKQADGSTSREYGGTGLGLSISRELSKLMHAQLSLVSTEGKGSTFSLRIPKIGPTIDNKKENVVLEHLNIESDKNESTKVSNPALKASLFIDEKIIDGKPLLLIVEDDVIFNNLLKDYAVNTGFDVVQLYEGNNVENEVIRLKPNAILLDIMLPDIDGWNVLKNLKENLEIAHIPVHIMSAGDFSVKKALSEGAISFIKKPINEEQLKNIFKNYLDSKDSLISKILLVEDQIAQSDALKELFKEKNIQVIQAFTGAEALEKLKNISVDCIVLDLNLPDISGEELLSIIKETEEINHIPVIINTAMELEQERLNKILKYSDATILKSPKSSDRLIDEVNLFLHKIKKDKKIETKINHQPTGDLKNKTVLLVDDDMRNVFALSAILDQNGMKIEIANDGIEALEKLEDIGKTVDIVLMDIMMPRMDGYETMQNIRKRQEWSKLPVIALTAKAMKDDREKSIAAGANDYIVKPVDIDQLISLMKIWIS